MAFLALALLFANLVLPVVGAPDSVPTHAPTSVAPTAVCPAGYRWSLSDRACRRCTAGRYQPEANSRNCLACPPGRWSSAVALDVECNACSPGRFNPTSSAVSSTSCIACGRGFSSGAGAASCVVCGTGFSTGSVGAAFCEPCPAGSVWTPASNATPFPSCAGCDLGRAAKQPASTECEGCTAGRYALDSGMCLDVIGGLRPKDKKKSSSCVPLFVECKGCPPGRASESELGANESVCVQCGTGTYTPRVAGNERCTLCPQGRYGQNDTNALGKGMNAACSACPPGRSQPQTGALDCDECEAGKFEDKQASRGCKPCPIGKYCSNLGSVQPEQCGLGFYCPSNGLSEPIQCGVDTFAGSMGSAVCLPCATIDASASTMGLTGVHSPRGCFSCPSGGVCDADTVVRALRREIGELQVNATVPHELIAAFKARLEAMGFDDLMLTNSSEALVSAHTPAANSTWSWGCPPNDLDCVCVKSNPGFYRFPPGSCVADPATGLCPDCIIHGMPCLVCPASMSVELSNECENHGACTNTTLNGCLQGYDGAFCESCIDGYVMSSGYCKKCAMGEVYGLVGFTSFALFFVLMFLVHKYLKDTKLGRAKSPGVMSIKVLISHLQIIGVVQSFDFDFPDVVDDMIGVFETASASSEDAISYQCIFQSLSDPSPYFAYCLVVAAILPCLYVATGLFWSIAATRAAPNKMRLTKKEAFFAFKLTIQVAHYLLLMITTKVALSLFSCSSALTLSAETAAANGIPSSFVGEHTFLEADTRIECGEGEHAKWRWLGVAMLLVYSIGIPIDTFVRMRRIKQADLSKSPFGFITSSYTEECRCWEIVKMVRKIAFAVTGVALHQLGTEIQATTGLLIIAIFEALQLSFKPYVLPEIDRLEAMAQGTEFITLICGLYLTTSKVSGSHAASYTFGMACLILNCLFVAYALYMTYWLSRDSLKQALTHAAGAASTKSRWRRSQPRESTSNSAQSRCDQALPQNQNPSASLARIAEEAGDRTGGTANYSNGGSGEGIHSHVVSIERGEGSKSFLRQDGGDIIQAQTQGEEGDSSFNRQQHPSHDLTMI